jgi:CRP-like cAMP-binding protein
MKKSKHDCDLQSCFLCRFCVKEWQPAISANRKNFDLKKGEVIINEGELVTGVCFAYSGNVKVHKKWGKDKELIVRFANDGAIFGHRGLGSTTVYPISATALGAGQVCFFDVDFFKATLKVNQEFAYKLLMFMADDLRESEKRMRNLAHMPVKGRIAEALLALKGQFGLTPEGSINIELTRQDLASFAGATYETVFRVINDFIQEGLVKVSGKMIWIINLDGLLAIINEGNS